jgi:hypothetical protein
VSWGALAVMIEAMRHENDAAAGAKPPGATSSRSAAELASDRALRNAVATAQTETASRRWAMAIPAFRAGHALITKRAGTFPLSVWEGDYRSDQQPAWLNNPDPRRTLAELVAGTLDDAIWHDRAYWRVLRRGADGYPLAFRRVPAEHVTEQPDPDGELPPTLTVNGKPWPEGSTSPGSVMLSDGRVLDSLIRMSWDGLGGFRSWGAPVLRMARALMEAAARYANYPQPSTVLKNKGIELDDDEIDDILDDWDAARAERVTAFLNRDLDLDTIGWSAKELQLVEAREHAAVEIARALALPATFLDAHAPKGGEIQYANVVDRRRDLSESLRVWRAPIEQALSLHALPRGEQLRFDDTAYVRDDPNTRMDVWEKGIRCGVLLVDEARAQEPLATGAPQSGPSPASGLALAVKMLRESGRI